MFLHGKKPDIQKAKDKLGKILAIRTTGIRLIPLTY